MAADRGLDFILKQGTAAAGTAIAGARSSTLTINNEVVDITNKDSAGAQTLLAAAGVQSMQITCQCVFTDSAVEETVRGYAFAQSINAFGIVFPNGDYLDGSWFISDYQREGEYNGAEMASFTLNSSGTMSYTAN